MAAERKLWYPPTIRYSGDPYSSVAFNHFSLIVQNVSGLEASEYLKRAILGPIGVGRVACRTTTGMSGTKWAAAGNGLMGARAISHAARGRRERTDRRTPASRRVEINRESLERFFDAVTDRYVACDGTVVNGGG